MKKENLLTLFVVVTALVPPIYLAMKWDQIPRTVPIHFNEEMQPDRYGDKNELWLVTLIITAVSFILFFLLKNIHRIDPKRKNKPSVKFTRLAAGLVLFISILSLLIILSSTKGFYLLENLLFPFLGLLFAFLGNYLQNIPPNYFAGFRVPWTLNDEENWRKTHKVAGSLWFWGGLSLAIISLLIPFRFAAPLFITVMVVLTLIPAIYSYRMFRGKR